MYHVANGTIDAGDATGNMAIQVLDGNGGLLHEVRFQEDFTVFTDPPTTTDVAPFGFAISYPPTAAQVQIVRAGQVLVQVNVTTKLLHDAVATIPDAGFREDPAERRKELFKKIDALDKKLAKQDFSEAREILHDEIREEILEKLVNGYPTQSPDQLTKDQILSLVDELVQRLPQAQDKDQQGKDH